MKKLLIYLTILISSINISKAEPTVDLLMGDARTACEVILCLSSGERPQECLNPLKHFFNILVRKHGFIKWGKTMNARKNFLNLCPSGNDEDNEEFSKLKNDVLSTQETECTSSALNKLQDKSYSIIDKDTRKTLIRTIYKLPSYCQKLSAHAYTDLTLPVQTCTPQYYSSVDWNKGYEDVFVGSSTKNTSSYHSTPTKYTEWLKSGGKGHTKTVDLSSNSTMIETQFYIHKPIKKICWIDGNRTKNNIDPTAQYKIIEKQVTQLSKNAEPKDNSASTNAYNAQENNSSTSDLSSDNNIISIETITAGNTGNVFNADPKDRVASTNNELIAISTRPSNNDPSLNSASTNAYNAQENNSSTSALSSDNNIISIETITAGNTGNVFNADPKDRVASTNNAQENNSSTSALSSDNNIISIETITAGNTGNVFNADPKDRVASTNNAQENNSNPTQSATLKKLQNEYQLLDDRNQIESNPADLKRMEQLKKAIELLQGANTNKIPVASKKELNRDTKTFDKPISKGSGSDFSSNSDFDTNSSAGLKSSTTDEQQIEYDQLIKKIKKRNLNSSDDYESGFLSLENSSQKNSTTLSPEEVELNKILKKEKALLKARREKLEEQNNENILD